MNVIPALDKWPDYPMPMPVIRHKTLYLIRGLPGSGKSTLATLLQASLVQGSVSPICETDLFFYEWDPVRGKEIYHFDPMKLADSHRRNQSRVEDFMTGNVQHIIVANTFTKHEEMQPYRELAKQYKYHVTEITVKTDLTDEELAERNIHFVPVETIRRMRERWEA